MTAPVTLNNPTVYNAAVDAFIAGGLAGALQNGTSFTALAAAAEVFAAALDTAVTPGIANLSSGNATTDGSTSAATACALASIPLIFRCLILGQMWGRYDTDITAADYAPLVAAVNAMWVATAVQLSVV
jgi:hypothetical protein